MSFTFTDKKGRTWDLELEMAAARRIDSSDFSALVSEKFSILRPDKQLFSNILQGTGLMLAMVWAVVRPQAMKMYETDKSVFPFHPVNEADDAEVEFMEGMTGSVIQQCREAFWRSLADFFPDHKTVLLLLQEKYQTSQAKILTAIQDIEPEMQEVLDEQIEMGKEEMRRQIQNLRKTPVE